MLPSFKQELSSEDKAEFQTYVSDEYAVEYTVGVFTLNGAKYRSYTLLVDDDVYSVGFVPESSMQTVQDTDVLVESGVMIVSHEQDAAWFIPAEVVGDSDIFPELRQAFHEADAFYDREADYRYHFADGSTEVAVSAANPVSRLEEPLTVTAVEFIGGFCPRKWLLETDDGQGLYLRERSGTIRMYDAPQDGELIFHAFIGREHPGTSLRDEEVLNIVSGVNYINFADDYDTEVSEDITDAYYKGFEDSFDSFENTDYEGLFETEDEDDEEE